MDACDRNTTGSFYVTKRKYRERVNDLLSLVKSFANSACLSIAWWSGASKIEMDGKSGSSGAEQGASSVSTKTIVRCRCHLRGSGSLRHNLMLHKNVEDGVDI